MNRNFEFITVKDYVKEVKDIKEEEITSAINYIEKLKKELLPNEFAV